MAFQVEFEPVPSIFATAISIAYDEPNLFNRMQLLHEAYLHQIAKEFNGKPDTAYTRAQIAARTDAMAREICMRGLLNHHESK